MEGNTKMRDLFIADNYKLTENSVEFKTDDKELQFLFDECERLLKENVKEFGDYKVLIEGAKYTGVWIETQPIGGEMYAKRNLKTALNNILIFIRYQRRDGKYPGMISAGSEWSGVTAHYDWMQGCFLPYPALKMYYHLGEDKEYLELLYNSLKDFDDYLWKYRDSTGNGCLENWCIWDVGEDNCTLHMLHGLKQPDNGAWGKSTPPENYGNLPHKSPQYMAYSYACRDTLAKISKILENGNEKEWEEKAKAVQQKAIEHLWDKDKNAFFVRDKNGEFIYALTQENIKCMYSRLFTQDMADKFIKEHFLNPDEFWTPYPVPAIAANDEYFHVNQTYSNCAQKLKALGTAAHDIDDNSWSGPISGLVWQRCIDSLMNYNHHAETVLLGKKVFELLKKCKKFKQNYNPFTGEPAEGMEGYGPTMSATLEYISILCGVNISYNEIFWSAALDGEYEYTQNISEHNYKLIKKDNKVKIYVDGELRGSFSKGVRVKTDMCGNVISIYGISEDAVDFEIEYMNKKYFAKIKPNEEWKISEEGLKLENSVPFDYRGR